MRKYMNLLGFEFKNLVRDKMTLLLLVYPLLVILIGAFAIPTLLDRYGDDGPGARIAVIIIMIIFASLVPFVTSAMLGFSLLDNRDEGTLDTIRVTPISLRGYIVFKSIYAYFLSVNASFWVLIGTRFLSGDAYRVAGENVVDRFTVGAVLIYALVASLFVPVFALFLSAVAKNKIEGFAYMKGAGIIIIIPALSALDALQDARQYFLSVMPLFWPVKGLMVQTELLVHDHNLPAWLYMIIGAVYMFVLIMVTYRVFDRKVQG